MDRHLIAKPSCNAFRKAMSYARLHHALQSFVVHA